MPAPSSVKKLGAKFKKGKAKEFGGIGGTWWEGKNYVEVRKEVCISVFSPDPPNKLKPTVLLQWKHSFLLRYKLSESQGYLVPANAKPLPQQTETGQQLFNANTLQSNISSLCREH